MEKKTMEHGGDNFTNFIEDCIIENGLNTEKSPVDLRRLAVTQSPLKDH